MVLEIEADNDEVDLSTKRLMLIIGALRWFQKTKHYALFDAHVFEVMTCEGTCPALVDDDAINELVEDLFTVETVADIAQVLKAA